MNILAVIPARGNSKGIPRKNMRLMHSKPLLYYSVNTAKSCNAITHIAVTSENDEILEYAESLGVVGLQRDRSLSGDDVTLDPVVYDATVQMEKRMQCKYDYVITLQPTSPILSVVSLVSAIKIAIDGNFDTLISVVNNPCLSWRNENQTFVQNYKERLNRQQLPAHYMETGAFTISCRNVVSSNSRFGHSFNVYELPEHEAVDIDTINDWALCEVLLKRKRIVFRTDGDKTLGMGHIYRTLALAYNLTVHEIHFVCSEQYQKGIEKIKDSHFAYHIIENDNMFCNLLNEIKPDIVVMDVLDTNDEDMKAIKKHTSRLVTFEDLGSGTNVADAVINALYTNEDKRPNVYTGHEYACLRDEFHRRAPKDFSHTVENVFVMFGGSDPANLTKKVYKMCCNFNVYFSGIRFNFITGLAYDYVGNNIVDYPEKNIYVFNDTNKVSYFMQQADLAITSQGRGTFELASLAVPSVVMALNEREKSHGFASLENGFVNLGYGPDVSEQTLYNTLRWLIDTPQIRKQMRDLMLGLDLKGGIDKMIKIILGDELRLT